MTLTEFLRARIAEDERAACENDMSAAAHTAGCGYDQLEYLSECRCQVPARVLAECNAKRRIVEEHPSTDPINHEGDRHCRRCLASGYDVGYPDEWVQAFYPCPTLRLLALPYADHPDFDESWRD